MNTTQPRPHWDSTLYDATSAAIQRFVTLEAPNPQFVYEVIAAVEDWHYRKRSQRVRTHSAECWRWHTECAEHLIKHLQQRFAQVQNQKDTLREDNSRLLRDNRRMSKAMARVQAVADSWLSWIHRSQEMGATPFTVGEAHFALTRALRGKKVVRT